MGNAADSRDQQAPKEAAQAAAQQASLAQYGPEAIAALQAGNYNAAWQDAVKSDSAYTQTNTSATADPLMADMMSAGGLRYLDPSINMNAGQMQQYYDAFAQATGNNPSGSGNTGFNGNLAGLNPYGLWGNNADTYAGVNAAAATNSANGSGVANIENYLGERPEADNATRWGIPIGEAVFGALSAGTGWAATAMSGMAGAADTAINSNGNASIGDILKSGAIGAVGNYAGSVAGGDVSAYTDSKLAGQIAGGATSGAVKSGLSGGNPLIGGATGAVAAGVGGGLSDLGFGSVASGIGSSLAGGATNSYLNNNLSSNSPNMAVGGNMGNSSSVDWSKLLSSAGGLAGNIGGAISSNANSDLMHNAYTSMQNGFQLPQWSSNNPWGGGASTSGNNLNINPGALGNTMGAYNGMQNNMLNMGNSFSGGLPQNIKNAFGQASNSTSGGPGATAFSNMAFGNAGNLMNSAGGNYNNAYNTSLNSAMAALNPAMQQSSNALLNSEFQRGQAGTSGGALQTQGLQNSFNQAISGAQGNAVNQANALMNTTYGAANMSNNMGVSAGGYGMNAANNNISNMFGQATAPATLAQPFLNNANMAGGGFTNMNNNVNAGVDQMMKMIQMQSNAGVGQGRNMAGLLSNPNFQASGAAGMGNMFNGLGGAMSSGGSNSILNSIRGLFGGGGSGNSGSPNINYNSTLGAPSMSQDGANTYLQNMQQPPDANTNYGDSSGGGSNFTTGFSNYPGPG